MLGTWARRKDLHAGHVGKAQGSAYAGDAVRVQGSAKLRMYLHLVLSLCMRLCFHSSCNAVPGVELQGLRQEMSIAEKLREGLKPPVKHLDETYCELFTNYLSLDIH